MGSLIGYRELLNTQNVFKLVIYNKTVPTIDEGSYSINFKMASELIKVKPNNRSMFFEKCFINVLRDLPEKPVIKDIDVMFNPAYKVDVMKSLISVYQKNKYSLIWPGYYAEGKLIYSEEGYSDHHVYEIKDYDIICVI